MPAATTNPRPLTWGFTLERVTRIEILNQRGRHRSAGAVDLVLAVTAELQGQKNSSSVMGQVAMRPAAAAWPHPYCSASLCDL